MHSRTSPKPRDMAAPLAVAVVAFVVGSGLVFITFVTLAGPWLGCVWLAADRPTIDAAFVWLDLLVGWFTCALAFWIAFRRWGRLSALLASATLVAQGVIFTACNARGFAAAWRGLWPGVRHLVAAPALLGWFFAPMMLLFILEFPRRRRSRLAAFMACPAVLISPLLIYHGLYGSLGEHPEV